MSHARRKPDRPPKYELTLLSNGGAELTINKVQQWASDSDDEFYNEFGEDILDENDFEPLLDYLVEQGYMSADEADAADVFVESTNMVERPTEPDDDEDDDEDDED